MKRHPKPPAPSFPFLALLALAGVLLVLTGAGCGNETDKANLLVGEVNDISAAVEPKLTEVESLLTQASNQLSAGQTEAEKASLTRAQQLLDEIIPEIKRAKEKTDEASNLQISDSYRQYLQAKARSLEASIKLTETSRELTNVFLADLSLENPDTLAKITELQTTINEQITKLNEAEEEANRIASENAGEIEQ